MNEIKCTMRLYMKDKRITLNRSMITALGSPSHLGFWYDEHTESLIFAPAEKDELDSYEIPAYFWVYPHSRCVISRIAFFNALIYRAKPESDIEKYLYIAEGLSSPIGGDKKKLITS